MTARDLQSGFTLIEALVAMAVLALGAVSLLTATEGHAARISAVTDRTAARWAGEYALTAARLGLPETDTATVMNRTFPVTVTYDTTDDPGLTSIDVAVLSPSGDSAADTLYRLSGYKLTGTEAEGNP